MLLLPPSSLSHLETETRDREAFVEGPFAVNDVDVFPPHHAPPGVFVAFGAGGRTASGIRGWNILSSRSAHEIFSKILHLMWESFIKFLIVFTKCIYLGIKKYIFNFFKEFKSLFH